MNKETKQKTKEELEKMVVSSGKLVEIMENEKSPENKGIPRETLSEDNREFIIYNESINGFRRGKVRAAYRDKNGVTYEIEIKKIK